MYVCVCMYSCGRVCAYMHVYVRICMFMFVCACVCVYARTCVYIYAIIIIKRLLPKIRICDQGKLRIRIQCCDLHLSALLKVKEINSVNKELHSLEGSIQFNSDHE